MISFWPGKCFHQDCQTLKLLTNNSRAELVLIYSSFVMLNAYRIIIGLVFAHNYKTDSSLKSHLPGLLVTPLTWEILAGELTDMETVDNSC